MEETPEVQVEVPTEKSEIIAEIKNQEDVQHPPQSSKKHTRSSSKFLEVLACLEKNLPTKKKDPGSFHIPCIIGDSMFERALYEEGISYKLKFQSSQIQPKL
ncbi:hypothetical protein PIB30_076124 [Stylosanthes scabra]|uniref:Uncharacterized protein n=1 Tax=Stylosanthes scabra TaxID=79078 RepID=A0ABU6YQH3_9FABA|nr:hypothetical protein [Stylosanthes scabra]